MYSYPVSRDSSNGQLQVTRGSSRSPRLGNNSNRKTLLLRRTSTGSSVASEPKDSSSVHSHRSSYSGYGVGPGHSPTGFGQYHGSCDNGLPCETPPTLLRSLQSKSSINLSAAGGSTSTSVTYAGQATLPRLPIPTLEETLQKFPLMLQPLQDERQQAETKRVVQEFLNGEGPVLQKCLLDYENASVESGEIGSYVEEFWNDSYLSPDSSVVLNLNPFFVLEDAPDPKMSHDQHRRAASLCFASIKFASVLKQETLTPDMFRGKPLCMDQFRALFGSSRHPKDHTNNNNGNNGNTTASSSNDEVHVYNDSCHVAVLCKNQFYYFRALWPESWNVAVDEDDITDILRAIRKHADKMSVEESSHHGLGILSSLPRSRWAQARDVLCQSVQNAAALNIIDSALFVLVLDDFLPDNVDETAANMLHGTNRLADGDTYQVGSCLNRWYDKLQLIVCQDGTAGCNFEHSSVDGHTTLRFVSDIFSETVISFADSIVDLIHGRGRIQHVVGATVMRAAKAMANQELEWDVYPRSLKFELSEQALQTIYYAETALCDEIAASETRVLEFKEYGKLLIVGNNLSPDSVVQMSIMLAYYKLYGKVVCMYEPVLTKTFYHGRTEAMRSATPEVKAFCETWCNKTSTPQEKIQALRVATMEHSRLVKEAACGFGVDRHLFSLKCIAERHGMRTPAFFESEAWRTLNHTILSTSNCGNPSLRLFGFGPVVPDGFGIGYIIKNHGLSFSVSTKHRQTQRYVRSLNNTLKEFKKIMKPTGVVTVERQSLGVFKPTTETPQTTYEDVFGENSAQTPSKKQLAVLHEHHEHANGRRSSGRRGSTFSKVVERNSSLDWLLNAEEAKAAVGKVEVEAPPSTGEEDDYDPAEHGTHWYF